MSYSIPSLRPFTTPITISIGACSYTASSNANTILLLHGENFIDYSSAGRTITNTNVTSVASPSKGAAFCNSMSFNGTNAYLTLPNDAAYSLSTYTIEAWIYVNSLASVMAFYSSSNFQCLIQTNGSVGLGDQAFPTFGTGGFITTGSWIHLAIVNNAGITAYVNGQVAHTIASRSMVYGNIGAIWGGNSNVFNGNMDEFRISSSAIYTSTFTPPAAAFA
jgi:hypothetical protein